MSTATAQAEQEQVEAVELVDAGTAIFATERAAVSEQISTAKAYPRSVDRAIKEAMTLATMDEETAGSCFYALPRSGKTIEGPSARLAEIMAYSWGNLRAEADIVAEDRTHVTAVGTCADLEKNVAVRVRVKRRITDRNGKRYNEDMIGVTSNAAISIALRNAVFKVIPQSFTRRIYQAARQASIGQGGTMVQKRQAALEWFGKLNIKPEQVFAVLSVRGLDDIGEDELITLRGLVNAIKEGETTIEDVFKPPKHSEGTDELNEALKTKAADEPDDDGPSSPMAQFLDVCEANGISIGEGKAAVATMLGKEPAKLRSPDYEKVLEDVELFVALFKDGVGDELPLDDDDVAGVPA